MWGYGSVGRASRSQCEGQGFESPYLHHRAATFGGCNRKEYAQGALFFYCSFLLAARAYSDNGITKYVAFRFVSLRSTYSAFA